MITIETNAKSLELTGEEVHVHFTAGFPYFWLRNDGNDTVLISLSPNISEGKDGVISVLAGSSAGTMHGFNSTRQDMYISGSGKVQVMATHTPENPFRNARKGGGDGNGDYSEFEQELDDIRSEVESLKTATGLGQLSVSNILNIPKGNSYRWVKIVTIAMPPYGDDPIATRGEIFNTDLQSPGGYYEFLISGRRRVFSAYPTFLVNNFRNSDDEIALIYVSETDPLELWYKCGGYSTYGSGTLYHAIHYSITQFTAAHSSSFLTDLPDYGTRIMSNSMYGN